MTPIGRNWKAIWKPIWKTVWAPIGRTYYVVGPASGWVDPTKAEILAGHLSGGGAATASGNQPSVTSTSLETFAVDASGLTASTSYKTAYYWADGTHDSNVAVTASWNTTAGSASFAAALWYQMTIGRPQYV